MDATARALKPTAPALDSHRVMRTLELKMRVQRADYAVDPAAVAAAMIRHAVSYRRWWNPLASCRIPLARRTTSGGPSPTVPIQVSGAADSLAERSAPPTHTHNS